MIRSFRYFIMNIISVFLENHHNFDNYSSTIMTLQEKSLYQQIHPARLIVDWTSGLYACYLFWHQEIITGIAVAFLPSLFVSLFVIRMANLEKLKNSRLGKYFQRTYNKTVDLLRFAGFVVMAGGSWYQFFPGIGIGLGIIILTWTYGIFLTPKNIL